MADQTTRIKLDNTTGRKFGIIPEPHAFKSNDVKAAFWLQKLAQDEDVEPEDLIAVINRNPLLSRIFLDYANSLRYGLKNLATPVTTMNRAVLMLGTRQVRRIADEIVMSIETVQSALDEIEASVE